MRHRILLSVLATLIALPASAQQPQGGTWEFGGFGRWTRYDKSFDQVDSTRNKNSFGGGGRIGYFFSPKWSLELDGSVNATDFEDTGVARSVGLIYVPFHLRVTHHVPLGSRFSWMVGVGPNYNRYTVSSEADEYLKKTYEGDDFGVGGLTGFRVKLTDWLSMRLSATLDWIPSPQNDTESSNTMLGVQAGLSLFLGGKCTDRIDSIRAEPRTQNVLTGDRASIRVNGYRCDGQVVDLTGTSTATLPAGGGTLVGLTFTAGTQAGCYDVDVTNPAARFKRTDRVQICVRERPRPVTLDRCELVPATATVAIDEAVQFRVVGHYSDGSSRDLAEATLNADGGTITNRTFRSSSPGEFTVTAQCGEGRSARATVSVRAIEITLRALFEFDRTNVYIQAERDSLRRLAQLLRDQPDLNLVVYGHTDWVGTVAYNEGLGRRRIQAVLDTLANHGVPRSRMEGWTRISYGECQPVADNRTREGRALNRRVEIFDARHARQYQGTARCPERP
jgi:outer membrane protein OmpA-like peptidoglycan-associated protein/outer membrane protein W